MHQYLGRPFGELKQRELDAPFVCKCANRKKGPNCREMIIRIRKNADGIFEITTAYEVPFDSV